MSKINRKRRAQQIELRHRRRAKVALLQKKLDSTKDEKIRETLTRKAKNINEHFGLSAVKKA